MTVRELINALLDVPSDTKVTVVSDPAKRGPDEDEFDIAKVEIIRNGFGNYVEIVVL